MRRAAFSIALVVSTARSEVDVQWLSDAQRVPGANVVAADVIPAAERCDADVEAIRNGNERVSRADTVEDLG